MEHDRMGHAFPPCCTVASGDEYAALLYAAYNRGGNPSTAGLSWDGKPCPVWRDLPENVKAKWRAVVHTTVVRKQLAEAAVAKLAGATSPFVFIEDRNYETGDGWRDQQWTVAASGAVQVVNPDGSRKTVSNPNQSFAWITRRQSWDDTECFARDELRESDILPVHPTFAGGGDVEGHFAFDLTPGQMRAHLEGLGMCCVGVAGLGETQWDDGNGG